MERKKCGTKNETEKCKKETEKEIYRNRNRQERDKQSQSEEVGEKHKRGERKILKI
jgi:hypothetical protein